MFNTAPYTTPDTTLRQTRSETSKLSENFINKTKNDEKKT